MDVTMRVGDTVKLESGKLGIVRACGGVATTEANRGPAINCQPYRSDDDMDVSFRVVSTYDVATDSVITRFDVLLNAEHRAMRCSPAVAIKGDQFNGGFYSTPPGVADLVIPKAGIIDAYAIRASGKDLSISLRALAYAIDSHLKPRGQP